MRCFRHKTVVAMLLLLVPLSLAAQDFPAPRGYVNDFAEVIDQSDERRIAEIAESVEEATGAQIAVATFDSLGEHGSIEQFSIALATEWGIGASGEDNGVLMVVTMKERRVRVEVGYGLEGALPDGMVGRIMDTSIVPYFKNNDFGTGFRKAAEGIAGIIAEEYDVELPNVSQTESRKYTRSSGGSSRNPIAYIIFMIIFFAGGGRFFWPLIFLGGFRRRGFTGGGFGTSSGGGFGGFGGGGFGGGGASRGF